jgi:hypothetical protein
MEGRWARNRVPSGSTELKLRKKLPEREVSEPEKV